jgi:hypothetical protein
LARGQAEQLRSRFTTLRVAQRTAMSGAAPSPQPEDELWLTKFWLSILLADIPTAQLLQLAKLRWLSERVDLELKHEIGLRHCDVHG